MLKAVSKISMITVMRNAASTLRDNLTSVCHQSVPVEHILIDGGSTDESLDIANDFPHVARIISEPDNGIYDAMNKGLSLATGEVVGMLNADDFFAAPDVAEKIIRVFNSSEVGACYGDLIYVRDFGGGYKKKYGAMFSFNSGNWGNKIWNSDENYKILRYWKSGNFNPKKFYHGWMPPHPTFFARRSVYEKFGGFNLNLGTAADYELMLRFLLKHRISAAYLPKIVTCMRVGGVSNSSIINRIHANGNDCEAWRVNGLKPYPWTLCMKPLRKIPQYFIKYL